MMLILLAVLITLFPQDLSMYLSKTYFSFKYGTFSTEELVKSGGDAGKSEKKSKKG